MSLIACMRAAVVELLFEVPQRFGRFQRCRHRVLCAIQWCFTNGHDGVADELAQRTAMPENHLDLWALAGG